MGIEVIYLALIPDVRFFELLPNVIYSEPLNNRNRHKLNLQFTIGYIRRNISKHRPDAIIGFTKFYAAITNVALVGTLNRIYVTERSSPLFKWPWHIELFCKLAFSVRRVSGVISQTQIASTYHQKYYGHTRYVVIPNILTEVKLFPEIDREKIILAVGRFGDFCKGFDLLVQAFNLVKDNEWRLVFVGGTRHEGQALLDLARDDVRDRIDFLGGIRSVDQEYARAGIFVMPSRLEGFPNALAEALSAGCCCVSFDFTAGPRDLINDGINGILVPAERTDLLAAQLNNLMANSELRYQLGQAALSTRGRLRGDNCAQQHVDFLRNVWN